MGKKGLPLLNKSTFLRTVTPEVSGGPERRSLARLAKEAEDGSTVSVEPAVQTAEKNQLITNFFSTPWLQAPLKAATNQQGPTADLLMPVMDQALTCCEPRIGSSKSGSGFGAPFIGLG